jgi:hypothetical protein
MSTVNNDALVDQLCADCEPCRSVACPIRRAVLWFAVAIPAVMLVVLFVLPPGDAAARMYDWRFLVEQAAALTIAVTAAVAAFAATIPGYDRRLLLLPALSLTVWLGSLAYGSFDEGLAHGLQELWQRPDWLCVRSILLLGAVPALSMAIMLRRGAPLFPHFTAALGGLAAAGLANFALRLFFSEEGSLMVLVWHVGTVMTLTVFAGWAGRYVLSWRAMIDVTRRKLATG